MISFLRRFWFEIVLAFAVFVFLVFTVIIVVAPHNDARMRGFSACSYEMAFRISYGSDDKDLFMADRHDHLEITEILKIIASGYACYFGVIKKGFYLYLKNKQSTPWENYLFVPETVEKDEGESESLSEDLLKANIFDEESHDMLEFISKEIKDGKKNETN